MNHFKFLNTNERRKILWLCIIIPILAIIVLLNIDIGINKSLVYFIATVVAFSYIMVYVKKSKQQIEEIVIMESSIKLYFFNKMKDAIILKIDEVKVLFEYDKLIFNDKNNQLICVAKKSELEESNRWDELTTTLKVWIKN